jgi:hypothetical protein
MNSWQEFHDQTSCAGHQQSFCQGRSVNANQGVQSTAMRNHDIVGGIVGPFFFFNIDLHTDNFEGFVVLLIAILDQFIEIFPSASFGPLGQTNKSCSQK